MFTTDDLIDAVLEVLAPRRAEPPVPTSAHSPPAPAFRRRGEESLPKGRPFLTELEVKRALTPGAQHLTIRKDAIVSPLALDWLALKGIRIVRE